MNPIQTIEITTDCYVRLIFNTDQYQKDTYISVRRLSELLDEDFERISALPENSADRERYIHSLAPHQDHPASPEK